THLATCVSCRALMARLSPADRQVAGAVSAWRVPRVDPKWLSLAAMLLVGVTLWMAWPRVASSPESQAARSEAVTAAPAPRPDAAAPGSAPIPPVAATDAPKEALSRQALDARAHKTERDAFSESGGAGARPQAAGRDANAAGAGAAAGSLRS